MIADQDEGERDEDGRIDQRGDRLPLHGRDDLRVLDEPPEHRVEAAAPLAGEQRRRVDAREEPAVRRERVGERRAALGPARGRRPARLRKIGDSTRRFSRSSDCTSGIPALSSVASSWLKTRNSPRRNSPRRWRQLQRQPADRRPSAAATGRRAPSPRARAAGASRSRPCRCPRRSPRSGTQGGSGTPLARVRPQQVVSVDITVPDYISAL